MDRIFSIISFDAGWTPWLKKDTSRIFYWVTKKFKWKLIYRDYCNCNGKKYCGKYYTALWTPALAEARQSILWQLAGNKYSFGWKELIYGKNVAIFLSTHALFGWLNLVPGKKYLKKNAGKYLTAALWTHWLIKVSVRAGVKPKLAKASNKLKLQ